MHEVLNIILTKPIPKVSKNFIDFEKSQNLPKNPKILVKNMKCMMKRGIKDLTNEEDLDLGQKSTKDEV